MHWPSSRDTGVDTGLCSCCWGITACHGHPTPRQQHCTYSKLLSHFPSHLSFQHGGTLLKSLLLSKLLTNRSNMSIWIIWWHKHGQTPQSLLSSPSAGLSRCLPLLGHHGMPKLTVKTSLIQLSRRVTFPCLDGRESCWTQEKAQTCICAYTHLCVCIHIHGWTYTQISKYIN